MKNESLSMTRSYFIGYVLSLVLTLVAFFVTKQQANEDGNQLPLMIALVVLAVSQLVVQLLFFFHLGKESKPRLNLVSFLFMLMVVGIVGFGSLWIMYNLNYNMSGHEMEQYIIDDEKIEHTESSDHSR